MPIRLERFSPNFEDAEKLGFSDIAPCLAYSYIYPLAKDAVPNLAYFFTYGYQQPQNPKSYTAILRDRIKAWQKDHSRSFLIMTDKETHLEIIDTRAVAQQRDVRLSGLERVLYLACDRICTINDLQRAADESGIVVSRDEIESTLQSLLNRGIMIRDDELYLSLAIDAFAKMTVRRSKPARA